MAGAHLAPQNRAAVGVVNVLLGPTRRSLERRDNWPGVISAGLLTRQSVPPVDPRVSRLDCPRAQPVRLRTVYIVRTQALNAGQPAFLEWD